MNDTCYFSLDMKNLDSCPIPTPTSSSTPTPPTPPTPCTSYFSYSSYSSCSIPHRFLDFFAIMLDQYRQSA